MASNNYLDYAKGADIIKPIVTLLDPEGSQNEGSIFRFMRLEQINDHQSQVTAYLSEDSWGALYANSSGIIGESIFLIDGEDFKSRLNYEPWSSNPLRIKATRRKMVRLECLMDPNQASQGLVDHLESPLYSGTTDEFQIPETPWDDSIVGTITDPVKFRARAAILNTFSKYQNDKSKRFVWFHVEENNLSIYGSEYSGGDAGISLIKVETPLVITSQVTNRSPLSFSIPARHLIRVMQLVDPQSPLHFRLNLDKSRVQFWSAKGWFCLPTVDAAVSRTLAVSAPVFLNNQLPFDNLNQRTFSAQEIVSKVAMQKPHKKTDPEGVRLECTDSHLVFSKLADKLRREESYALFAGLDGSELPWRPIVAYQSYLIVALNAILKFCKQLTEEELFETGGAGAYNDFDFEEEGDDFLGLVNEPNQENSHLLSITQGYLPAKDMWCLFIDPVPYGGCTVYLAANVEDKLDDFSEDNV